MAFGNILRGMNGDYELIRTTGAFGILAFVITACGLVAYKSIWIGQPFDVQTFCFSFAGGLSLLLGGTAGSAAIKDRNVAAAKIVSETGAQPAVPPAPTPLAPTDDKDAPWNSLN